METLRLLTVRSEGGIGSLSNNHMLKNFFALNAPFTKMTTPDELVSHLDRSDHLKDVLYEPDILAPDRPKNRIKGKRFTNVSFAKTTLRNIEFRSCEFEDCLFIGTVIDECEFHRCRFTGCNPHKIEIRGSYIDPEIFASLLNRRDHANIGVHLFQQLLANSSETHQHDFSKSAEYHFRKWKRFEIEWERRNGEVSRIQYFQEWLPNYLYWLLAGYGLRSKFFAIWTVVLLVGIVSLNHIFWESMGINGGGGPVPTAGLIETAYFSLITISTVGYGDFVPTTTLGMAIIACEAILGIVWLSLFASTVIKRVSR